MEYGIILIIIVAIAWSGVFDLDSNEENMNYDKGMITPNQWENKKHTAQLYSDIYISEQYNGKYFVLKIGENNYAAINILNYRPYASSKNELILELDNRIFDLPEINLSDNLGLCKIFKNQVKIYFADLSLYHIVSEPPFSYVSLEGTLDNKILIFNLKERYYDQTLMTSKIRTLKENIRFKQL